MFSVKYFLIELFSYIISTCFWRFSPKWKGIEIILIMKAKFAGHDTFPLRYGWLYKAINHLNNNGKFQTSNDEHTRRAIVELGVGKNMVNAIRYWAEATSLVKPHNNSGFIDHSVDDFGKYIFGDSIETKGVDPFLENSGSVWLIHFLLNFNHQFLTGYRYFFNFSNVQSFEKKKLLEDFVDDATHIIKADVGHVNTLKKDLDCFLNTYAKKRKTVSIDKQASVDEDHFSSPLTELNLISETSNAFFISELNERPDLPIEIFVYALLRFVELENDSSGTLTLDFDSLLTKPFSPGRIFRLSESGLGHKLDDAQEFTKNKIIWVDSLGLRQVRVDESLVSNPFKIVETYYGDQHDK